MCSLEAGVWLERLPKEVVINLGIEERSLFVSGGCWDGPELLGCAEGPRPRDSSHRPGVSEDTQDEQGRHSQDTQSQHSISEVTGTVLYGSSCGTLGEI